MFSINVFGRFQGVNCETESTCRPLVDLLVFIIIKGIHSFMIVTKTFADKNITTADVRQ